MTLIHDLNPLPSLPLRKCKEVREEAHREAEEGEAVAGAKEKIDGDRPEEKEEEEGCKLEDIVSGGLAESGGDCDREHSAAVEASYREQIEQAQEQGSAGEQASKGEAIPQKGKTEREQKAEERSGGAEQPLFTVAEQTPDGVHPSPQEIQAQCADGNVKQTRRQEVSDFVERRGEKGG